MQAEILNNLLIDAAGVLREQHQGDKERSLCHTARMKNEYENTDTLIQLFTRLDPRTRQQYALGKLEQWLIWYIGTGYDLPEDAEMLHKDVKAIYNSVAIREWWWQLWRKRDLDIINKLALQFNEVASKMQKKCSPEARMNAQHYCAENYMLFHSYIFCTTSEDFKGLEYEYAVIIDKAK